MTRCFSDESVIERATADCPDLSPGRGTDRLFFMRLLLRYCEAEVLVIPKRRPTPGLHSRLEQISR